MWNKKIDKSWTYFDDVWRAPKFLDKLNCESEVKTTEKSKVGARSLTCNALKVEGRARPPGWN
jgi:hypothetical protein